jgi:hypothetical protein
MWFSSLPKVRLRWAPVQFARLKFSAALIFSFLFAFQLLAKESELDIPPETPIVFFPTNAIESTSFAKKIRKIVDAEAERMGVAPTTLTFTLYYNDPAVANSINVQHSLTILHRKGYRVQILPEYSMNEIRQAVDELEPQIDDLVERTIAIVQDKPFNAEVKPEFRPTLRERYKFAIRELKKFFGLRRNFGLGTFVNAFVDNVDGIRRPIQHTASAFLSQFFLIPVAFCSALFSGMQNPEIIKIMGFKPEFWNLLHYKIYWELHNKLIEAGHPLSWDPMYVAYGYAVLRLFWAFQEPSADALLKQGIRLDVYSGKPRVTLQWSLFMQNILSFGDTLVVLYACAMNFHNNGMDIPIWHKVGVTMLLTFSGTLVKSLPKMLLLNLQERGVIKKGWQQNFSNGALNSILTAVRIFMITSPESPIVKFYFGLAGLGLLYNLHIAVLNRSEAYRNFFRSSENKVEFVKSAVVVKSAAYTSCLLSLSRML